MTGYEQELRKLFENSGLIDRPQFSGRVCVGELGKDLRVRAELFSPMLLPITMQYVSRYSTAQRAWWTRPWYASRMYGGKRIVPGNPNFRSGVIPHLRSDYGELDWYVYHPDAADYDILRQAIGQYLSAFRERVPERSLVGSKLVYICAPLQGNVKKNIEFARQKALEVFADGDVPVCPHILFSYAANPNHPEQDAKTKEMSLRLLEACQQVNVYGSVWTDEMWDEIHHASKLGIPMMTDQKTIGRTPPRRSGRKER